MATAKKTAKGKGTAKARAAADISRPLKRTAGRPAFEPTAEQRALVKNLAGIRCTAEEILECVPWPDGKPIDEKTLRKHFAVELSKGRGLANMKLKKKIADMVEEGNTAMVIFCAKTQLGWKETIEVQNTGKDGAELPANTGPVFYLPAKDTVPAMVPRAEAEKPGKGA